MRGIKSVVALTTTALLIVVGSTGVPYAHELNMISRATLPHSAIPGLVKNAGLWDKPNQACITKCEAFVKKGCFKTLAEKQPGADPGSLQDQCDDKFSLCLYDCMCDTCDENQIIIKQP